MYIFFIIKTKRIDFVEIYQVLVRRKQQNKIKRMIQEKKEKRKERFSS